MISNSLTRRYARALLAIGIDMERFEQFGEQLRQFSALWTEHKDLRPTLENPSYPLSRRRAVISGIGQQLGMDPTVQRFLLLLLDRSRIQLVSAIARDYSDLADTHAGRVRAHVTSARALEPQSLQRLQAALQRRTGKNVLISADVQPDLLAGTVTRVGTTIYDGSLSNCLEQLKQALIVGRL